MIQNVEEGRRLAKGKYKFWCHLYFYQRRYRLGLMGNKYHDRKQMTLYCVGVWSPLGVQENLRHAQNAWTALIIHSHRSGKFECERALNSRELEEKGPKLVK